MKNLKYYFPGKGCRCFADGPNNCGCTDVDWTPREVYVLTDLLQRIVDYGYLNDVESDLLEEIKNLGIKI